MPVKSTSPGLRVNPCEREVIIWGMVKIMLLVRLSCFNCPGGGSGGVDGEGGGMNEKEGERIDRARYDKT